MKSTHSPTSIWRGVMQAQWCPHGNLHVNLRPQPHTISLQSLLYHTLVWAKREFIPSVVDFHMVLCFTGIFLLIKVCLRFWKLKYKRQTDVLKTKSILSLKDFWTVTASDCNNLPCSVSTLLLEALVQGDSRKHWWLCSLFSFSSILFLGHWESSKGRSDFCLIYTVEILLKLRVIQAFSDEVTAEQSKLNIRQKTQEPSHAILRSSGKANLWT